MNLVKAVATVSGITFLSRIFGLLRDILIAHIFGASAASDAFFTAFKIPNLLRRIFAEGAFSQAFVPILAEFRSKRGEQETHSLIDHIAALLALSLLIVSILGVIAAPLIITITATGFRQDANKFALAVTLLRWLFPYILLISLASLASAILNAWHKFSVPAFTPTLLNICIILAAVFLAPYCSPPILALAIGVLAGGAAQLLFQLPYLARLGLLPKPKLAWRDPAARRVLVNMGPAILGVSIAQISLLINTWFASYLPNGSISWLYNADRMMELPSALLGVALGTVLLPSLSRLSATGTDSKFSDLIDWGLRLTLVLAAPAALGLALLAKPLLATLFLGGKFTVIDVEQTAYALTAYMVGLLGIILIKILAPGFYAHQDIKTPVKIGIVTLLFTQALNLVLIRHLAHVGLALSIGLGACLNATLLLIWLRRRGWYTPVAGWGKFCLQLAAGLAAMGVAVWVLQGHFSDWVSANRMWRVAHLSLCVISGSVVYFAVLYMTGLRYAMFHRHLE